MMDFSPKKMKKFFSPQKRQIDENLSTRGKCQNQKKKRDFSVDSQYTKTLYFSGGMNTEIKKLLYISTKKTGVVITISSVNHEEVNQSSSDISHARISGLVKVSASSILTEIS